MITRSIYCPFCGNKIVQNCYTTNELLKQLEDDTDEAANDIKIELIKEDNKDAINYWYADVEPLLCSKCGCHDSYENFELLNNEKDKSLSEKITFDLAEAIRISGVKKDQFILFYTMRGYIKKESYGYSATALGIEKGCVINDDKYNALYTMEAIIRVSSAMAA